MFPSPNLPRKSAWLLLPLLLVCASASAQIDIEVQGGVSVTTGGEHTAVAAASWLPVIRDTNAGHLRLDLGVMHFDGRTIPRRDLAESVDVLYLGLRSEHENGFLWGAGIGAQSGNTDALSGDPQFVSSVGWRWAHFSLMLRHVSNAGLHEPNDGETALLAGWRF